jgi:hypothetical protein
MGMLNVEKIVEEEEKFWSETPCPLGRELHFPGRPFEDSSATKGLK